MSMAANPITSVEGAGQEKKTAPQLKYSVFLFVAFVLMAVAVTYVWSHVQMTKLEYQVAEEMTRGEQLLDEQRKLKLEQATLKSPQRIEAIAKGSLSLSYPDKEQVILIKDTGAVK
jgi:cell division protein FtsL